MNPDTGHLIDERQFSQEELENLQGEYQQVPNNLTGAVKKKLAGKREAKVSLTSGGKLSQLCAKWRQEKRARYVKKLGKTEINRRREKRRKQALRKRQTNMQQHSEVKVEYISAINSEISREDWKRYAEGAEDFQPTRPMIVEFLKLNGVKSDRIEILYDDLQGFWRWSATNLVDN